MALKNDVLDRIMIFSSRVLPYLMVALICATFLFGVLRHNAAIRKNATATVFLIAINLMINFLIGAFLYIPRPFVHHKVNLLFPHASDSSFPSDHATVTMGTAVGLMRVDSVMGWICVFLSLLVGFSRIYVGQHYPLDVLGSYLIVMGTSVLFYQFFEKKFALLYFWAEKKLFPGW
jgi:undecaprenyl-diphosphatase